MANIIEKIPPQALDAEMAVLGAILIEKEAFAKIIDIISEKDFYKDLHGRIFIIIRDLYNDDVPIDVITLSDKLSKNPVFVQEGGTSYLNSLIDLVQTSANVEQYARIIREKSILRQLVNAGNEIVNQSFNEVYPAEEILDKSQNTLYQISQVRNNSGFTMISELVRPALNKLEKLHLDKRDVPGQRTGFDAFDSLTAGFQKSDLVIIAARPSMGKTSFALNIAEYVAIEEQKPVIIFSLEMSKESLTMRFLSSVARVDAQNLRKGKFTIAEWQKVTSAVADKISKAPIYIDDSSDINAIEMRARARRLAVQLEAQKTPLAMIVIDYIQIMRGNSGRSESRQQEVAEISRSLKGLARDLKVPVVALSQLSRKTEDRSRKESGNTQPVLSDLRESGAIEQDADLVAFIHYNKDELKNSVDHSIGASIIIGKQRNGPTGEIKLLFESRYTKFSNMDYSFKNEEEQDAV